MKSIAVFEINSVDQEHAKVNCGYVRLLSKMDYQVTLVSTLDHANEIKNLDPELKFEHIDLSKLQSPYLSHSRQIKALGKVFVYYTFKKRFNKLIFLTVTPLSIIIIKLLGFILAKKLYVVLHSELDKLEKNVGYITILRALLFPSISRVQYIVNHNHIYKKIKNEHIRKKIKVVNLPYMFSDNQNDLVTEKKFCSFGLYSDDKNSFLICELAKKVFLKNEDIKIGHVGKVKNPEVYKECRYLDPKPKMDMISNEAFQKELLTSKAILMFPDEKFQYFALSGIILDAINFKTPIISLKSQVLSELSVEYPGLIFCFETISEMVDAVLKFDVSISNIYLENYRTDWEMKSWSDLKQLFG